MSLTKLAALYFAILVAISLWYSPSFAAVGAGGVQWDNTEKLMEHVDVITNGDFEAGTSSWVGISGVWSIDETVAYSGDNSLKLTAAGTAANAINTTPVIGKNAGRFSFWGKGQDLVGNTTFTLNIFDSTQGTVSIGSKTITTFDNTNTWTRYTYDMPMSDFIKGDTLQARFTSSAGMSSGTIWVDNLVVMPLTYSVRSFLKYPNYKGIMWSDKSQTATVTIESDPAAGALADYNVKVDLCYDNNDVISTQLLAPPNAADELTFDLSSYADNTELLVKTTMRNVADNTTYATYYDWRIVKKNAAVRDTYRNHFNENNVWVKEGTPKYIYGVYLRPSGLRCTGCLWDTQAEYETGILGYPNDNNTKLVASYDNIALNSVLYWTPMSGANPGIGGADTIGPWMAALDAIGATHIHIVSNLFETDGYFPSHCDAIGQDACRVQYASLLTGNGLSGWYLADEPVELQTAQTQHTVYELDNTFRVNSPDVYTLTMLMSGGTSYLFRDAQDVYGSDPYYKGHGVGAMDKVHGETAASMARVYNYLTENADHVYSSRPVVAALQLYQPVGDVNTYPTQVEMQNMAVMAIVAGANGILWWGDVSVSGLERQVYTNGRADAWDNLVITTQFLQRVMDNVLVTADNNGHVTSSDANVKVRVKEYGGKTYLFASNIAPLAASTTPTFTVNGNSIVAITLLNDDSVVSSSVATFSDTFTAYQGKVYEMTLGDNPPHQLSTGSFAGSMK